jgi:hypothetical protein
MTPAMLSDLSYSTAMPASNGYWQGPLICRHVGTSASLHALPQQALLWLMANCSDQSDVQHPGTPSHTKAHVGRSTPAVICCMQCPPIVGARCLSHTIPIQYTLLCCGGSLPPCKRGLGIWTLAKWPPSYDICLQSAGATAAGRTRPTCTGCFRDSRCCALLSSCGHVVQHSTMPAVRCISRQRER